MKFLIKLLRRPIKRIILKKLQDPSVKRLVVAYINVKMDIPKLTEKQENNLITSIYNAATEAITEVIEKL